jgi:hypothetical protein
MITRALLVEEVLKKDKFEFEIDYDVDSTEHAELRKSRIDNDGKPITDEEITQDIETAMEEISHDLVFNNIEMGDKIIIKNGATHLHIVAQLRGKEYSNTIVFKIVTVMRKENFWVNRDTRKVIKI